MAREGRTRGSAPYRPSEGGWQADLAYWNRVHRNSQKVLCVAGGNDSAIDHATLVIFTNAKSGRFLQSPEFGGFVLWLLRRNLGKHVSGVPRCRRGLFLSVHASHVNSAGDGHRVVNVVAPPAGGHHGAARGESDAMAISCSAYYWVKSSCAASQRLPERRTAIRS